VSGPRQLRGLEERTGELAVPTFELDSFPFVQARHFRANGGHRAVRLIVIHSMEAPEKGDTAEKVARFFQTSDRPASAHLCIDNDSVVRCVRDDDVAFAAPGANADGVHLELAGFARQTETEWLDPFGVLMLERAADVAAQHCLKYDIPARRLTNAELADASAKGIVSHAQVSETFKKSDHTDPGSGFPWQFFLERIARNQAARQQSISNRSASMTAQPAPPSFILEEARSRYKVKNVEVDLSVPESPAFTSLGLNPETIVRPATPREFATALLNGVDQQGNLQTGVAFDTVPYLVFAGSELWLADYRRSALARVLSRTSVSVATTKGASDGDKSVKLGVGVHATLIDSEDPRMNNETMLKCFSDIPVFRPSTLTNAEAERAAFERDVLQPHADSCREQFRRKAGWNSTSWIVAFATTTVSPTGLSADLGSGSTAFWTSMSYGFDGVPGLSEHAQIIGHARHVADEVVVDKDLPGGQELRNTTIAGAQFRGGTVSFGLSFEAAYLRTTAVGRDADNAMRLTFSAERRLAPDVWLTVSFGGDRGAAPALDKGLSVLSALKWGFAKSPALTNSQQ